MFLVACIPLILVTFWAICICFIFEKEKCKLVLSYMDLFFFDWCDHSPVSNHWFFKGVSCIIMIYILLIFMMQCGFVLIFMFVVPLTKKVADWLFTGDDVTRLMNIHSRSFLIHTDRCDCRSFTIVCEFLSQ